MSCFEKENFTFCGILCGADYRDFLSRVILCDALLPVNLFISALVTIFIVQFYYSTSFIIAVKIDILAPIFTDFMLITFYFPVTGRVEGLIDLRELTTEKNIK